jgi:signal transduction histidine kinase
MNRVKISIKNQVIILFVIVSLMLIALGYFNYASSKDYETNIRKIRNTVIAQLSILREISVKASKNQIDVLHYLYAASPERKEMIENRITERFWQVDILIRQLEEKLPEGKVTEDLELLMIKRDNFVSKVTEVFQTPDPLAETVPFLYEESDIRYVYNEYSESLEGFSGTIIQNAEDDIAAALQKAGRTRLISNILIGLGLLLLVLNSYLTYHIYKKLTRDYLKLKSETTDKEAARAELKLLNEQLEEKVKERTAELEKVNTQISLYNKELAAVSKAKDKFISVISHDLRNPLSTVLSSSEILYKMLQESDAGSELIQFASIINKSSQKLTTQLNELVRWAKARNVKAIFNPVLTVLWERVHGSLQLLENLAKEKNVKLINEVSPGIFVKADKIMLRSVIQNLVTNSIKFTPSGGYVTISASENEENVEVRVEDNGTGMSEEVQKTLFSGVPDSGPDADPQSGLGLVLVKEFVEKHGGKIRVESEEGKGSSFIFTLPKA